MKQQIAPHMFLIEDAEQAMRDAGVEPLVVPIRGGTDGARLSFMGLPCPNLSTGGHNFHGRFEISRSKAWTKWWRSCSTLCACNICDFIYNEGRAVAK